MTEETTVAQFTKLGAFPTSCLRKARPTSGTPQ